MAMSLMNRAISRTETVGAFRLSFNLLRNFSASPAASPPSSENPSSDANKPKRRKKKNLIEVAQLLPNWGIGYHMAKADWNRISYEISKINLYQYGRHGKAWGIVHKDGKISWGGWAKYTTYWSYYCVLSLGSFELLRTFPPQHQDAKSKVVCTD